MDFNAVLFDNVEFDIKPNMRILQYNQGEAREKKVNTPNYMVMSYKGDFNCT